MANPYVYTKEVVEPKLFAGRKIELKNIQREILNFAEGQPFRTLALVGVRRVGKTSTLLRIKEFCEKKKVMPVMMTIEERHAENPWIFWFELLRGIISVAVEKGIVKSDLRKPFTFWSSTSKRVETDTEYNLIFAEAQESNAKGVAVAPSPANYVLESDLQLIMQNVVLKKYRGLIILFDEAQKLQEKNESKKVKESLREITRNIKNIGLIFAGIEHLGSLINDYWEPFYNQGHIVPITNFTSFEEIAECALLPLKKRERELISPMTMDYLALLSQGMPNQVRLICHAVYERFMEKKQPDLNLTIDVMDNLLDVMEKDASVKGELNTLVDAIKGLDSIDLETLYKINRYPQWSGEELIDLDESFRGEAISDKTIERRKRILEEKRGYFIENGLMRDIENKLIVSGDEYAHLYLRFWYEIMKYGELSRQIIINRGPLTAFGEKTSKLADAIGWELKNIRELSKEPGILISVYHPETRDRGQLIVERVLKRYETFKKLKEGIIDNPEECMDVFLRCLEICKFVEKPGDYLLICLSVRNRDRPRELIQLEMYHKVDRKDVAILSLGPLHELAKHARINIEGHAQIIVELPNLDGLLNIVGTCPDEFLDKIPMIGKWQIDSVQRLVHEQEADREKEEKEEKEKKEDILDGKWIDIYGKDDIDGAKRCLTEKIALCLGSDRKKLARLYNDRGYIYSGNKNSFSEARNDLALAFDYYYTQLQLCILNLAYLDIAEKDYKSSIKKIEDVLFITHAREEVEASYLRTMLPKTNLSILKQVWEHKPANILEVSYIDLAYAMLNQKNGRFEKALEILREGLELLPSSTWLKHAIARYHIFNHNSELAEPIYRELSKSIISDQSLKWEISEFTKLLSRGARRIDRMV